jgi:hypothetical protein
LGVIGILGSLDDGPAAILRVTIDVSGVSGVSGADTSGGFGSVYFSTRGPVHVNHIKVADFTLLATHTYQKGSLETLSGEFYVTDYIRREMGITHQRATSR